MHSFKQIDEELSGLRIESGHRSKTKLNPFEAEYEATGILFNGHFSFASYRQFLDGLFYGFTEELQFELGNCRDTFESLNVLDHYHLHIKDLRKRALPDNIDLVLFELNMQGFTTYYRERHTLEDIKKKF